MSFCRNYTVMEVKEIMLNSEGEGPGTGGHAIATHGSEREDVTDRRKPKDSAFHRGWTITTATDTKSMVHSSDQYIAVCNALNSTKGQAKLKQLDTVPANTQVVFETPVSLGHLVPTVRQGTGSSASSMSLKKMHIELFNIGGRLHIHTAYAV